MERVTEKIIVDKYAFAKELGLTQKQAQAIVGVIEDKPYKVIAHENGISERTLSQRVNDTKFKIGINKELEVGHQRTVHGMIHKLFERKFIVVLNSVLLCFTISHALPQQVQLVRRPAAQQRLVARRIDEIPIGMTLH